MEKSGGKRLRTFSSMVGEYEPRILHSPRFKAFAEDNFILVEMMKFAFDRVENRVGQLESADHHVLNIVFVHLIIMPAFNQVGVYCFANVGRSVRRSVDLTLYG